MCRRDEARIVCLRANGLLGARGHGRSELRPLWPDTTDAIPKRVLITGGASCPDGIIQQAITRINGFFPENELRPIEDVLRDLQQ